MYILSAYGRINNKNPRHYYFITEIPNQMTDTYYFNHRLNQKPREYKHPKTLSVIYYSYNLYQLYCLDWQKKI